MITLQQLTKRYRKKEVYDAISLEIPAGGMTLFIGQNGIGKSTLLKMIAGIEQPDAGVILYDGAQWTASEYFYLNNDKNVNSLYKEIFEKVAAL